MLSYACTVVLVHACVHCNVYMYMYVDTLRHANVCKPQHYGSSCVYSQVVCQTSYACSLLMRANKHCPESTGVSRQHFWMQTLCSIKCETRSDGVNVPLNSSRYKCPMFGDVHETMLLPLSPYSCTPYTCTTQCIAPQPMHASTVLSLCVHSQDKGFCKMWLLHM